MASPTTSDSAAATAPPTCDGPVLNLINKRIRALRKKLNRISLMESSLSQGNPLNSEQLEVLRSKPSVVASLDELKKLRPSLVSALQEELDARDRQPPPSGPEPLPDTDVTDLVHLLYLGTMFAVASQGDYTSTMLTRTHERSCCLTYDYVTDDEDDHPLSDRDLDLIASLSRSLVSRPKDSGFSHEKALHNCLEHTKLWLARSEQPIEPASNVTYAALRERLNKIMSLEYFTTMPEMKAPVEVAAAGNYAQLPVQESFVAVQVEGSVEQVEQKEKAVEGDFLANEADKQLLPPNDLPDQAPDEVTGDDPADYALDQQENISPQGEELDDQGEIDPKNQQYVPRRNFQNYRGGRGGGHRGYPNGRGGRSGGSGGGRYQNGRSYSYEQPGNYYPRNYYNNHRGRGGSRGGVHPFSNHGSGDQGGYAPSDIGVAS